ncbi:PTS sugar transporter subunit IIB, partial [Salmonella enterica subsp. enterica serovar Kentucky]|nr:PTS sugar transporter subunit IIB [Salmonella enterica subsp. enterica serovar Kentucky]
AAAPKAATPAKPMGPNDYMVIGLARIDDRLIHGQVATRWTKEIDAWKTDVLPAEERGAGAAISVLGYRLGMLVSGGLALWLADR